MSALLNRTKIRNRLSHGVLKSIATNAKVHPVNVSHWFSGRLNSDRIEQAVLEAYEEQIKLDKIKMKRYKKLALA